MCSLLLALLSCWRKSQPCTRNIGLSPLLIGICGVMRKRLEEEEEDEEGVMEDEGLYLSLSLSLVDSGRVDGHGFLPQT